MTGKSERRPPPKITPSYIENAALHYLERYSTSSANLRRVLMRKVDRSLAHWGGEPAEAAAMVDAALAKLQGLGYLDDARYAEGRSRSLHRRGGSLRTIRASLAAKGVAGETADQAVAQLKQDQPDADLAAAVRLARRRRLGPFRTSGDRVALRTKDLAALGRAGFAWDIARRVVEATSPEALEADLDAKAGNGKA
jgi:regulatory protein